MEKRISFSAEGTGVMSAMQRMRNEARSMSQEMIRDAQRYSESASDQVRYIEEQIRAIERRNKLDKEGRLFELRQRYEGQQQLATTDEQRAQLTQDYNQARDRIQSETEEDRMQTTLLRDILDTLQQTANEELSQDRRLAEREARRYERMSASRRLEEYEADEGLIRGLQSEELEGQRRPGLLNRLATSTFGQTFAALTLNNLVSSIGGALRGGVLGAASATSGETFLPQLIQQINPFGIPVGAFFGTGMQRAVEAEYQYQRGSLGLEASVGSGLDLSYDAGPGRSTAAQRMGYSMSEVIPIAQQIAIAMGGIGNRDLNMRALEAIALERGYGLERGNVDSLYRGMRSAARPDITPVQNVELLLQLIPDLRENLQLLDDVVSLQGQLVQAQLPVMATVDRALVAGMLGRFSSIDSEFFNDPTRSGAIIQSINQSLQSPGNDFSRARNFEVLARTLGGGASYFDIIQAQSQGIMQEGFLGGMLDQLVREVGGGENLMLALTGQQYGGGGILNLAPAVARELANAYLQSPDMFDQFAGTEEDLSQMLGTPGAARNRAIARGQRFTAQREIDEATIADKFITGFSAALPEIGRQIAVEFAEQLRQSAFLEIPIPMVGTVDFGDKSADLLEGLFSLQPAGQ